MRGKMIWLLLMAVAFGVLVLVGCSAKQIGEQLAGANAVVAEADAALDALEAERQAVLGELALLPEGEPGREPLIERLESLAGAHDKWVAIHSQYMTRAHQLEADLLAAGDDDAAATMYAGAGLLELAAAAGIPFAGMGALVLRLVAKRRQEHTDTAYGIASARAASEDFNRLFDGPVGAILRANIPEPIAAMGAEANRRAEVGRWAHPGEVA